MPLKPSEIVKGCTWLRMAFGFACISCAHTFSSQWHSDPAQEADGLSKRTAAQSCRAFVKKTEFAEACDECRVQARHCVLLQVKLEGKLSIYFYDTEAGAKVIKKTSIPARSGPKTIKVVVDASNVPSGERFKCCCSQPGFPGTPEQPIAHDSCCSYRPDASDEH